MWRPWRRRELENDLQEEVRSHLAIEGGDSAQARRLFGNITRIKEETREQWGWVHMERFLQDLRFGLRMLRKSPGWTAIMAATLALGIGLATSIFSVVYSVLLQPLPYPHPERLVSIQLTLGAPAFQIGGQSLANGN